VRRLTGFGIPFLFFFKHLTHKDGVREWFNDKPLHGNRGNKKTGHSPAFSLTHAAS